MVFPPRLRFILSIIFFVEDLTPGSSNFSWRTKFLPRRVLNLCPPDQELGVLTKELASPLKMSGSRQDTILD